MHADEHHATVLSGLRRAADPVAAMTALAAEAERTARIPQPEGREREHHRQWSQTAAWLRMLAAKIPHYGGVTEVQVEGRTLSTGSVRLTPLFAPRLTPPVEPLRSWAVHVRGRVADGSSLNGLVGPFPDRSTAGGWVQENLDTGSAVIVPLAVPEPSLTGEVKQVGGPVGDVQEIGP